MGTKTGERVSPREIAVRFLFNEGGSTAQLLHPYWLSRGDASRAVDTLLKVDALLDSESPQVLLVVTGGGFLEVWLGEQHPPRFWRSEAGLNTLLARARKDAQVVGEGLRGCRRDYVVGLDYVSGREGVGQFALVLGSGGSASIVWKSYPVGREDNTLAGFGTSMGRKAPRVVRTTLGHVLVLVCHDAQAFNHRNIASVGSASAPTPRMQAMQEMARQVASYEPPWVLNLVHQIARLESTRTFRRSYKQIHLDHAWHPKVVGAFGYELPVQVRLAELAKGFQFPRGTSRCALAVGV